MLEPRGEDRGGTIGMRFRGEFRENYLKYDVPTMFKMIQYKAVLS